MTVFAHGPDVTRQAAATATCGSAVMVGDDHVQILKYKRQIVHFYMNFFFLDQTNECSCLDSADCSNPGINVCVRVGEDGGNQTMSECEAGLKRCKGEQVSVVSILPCAG